MGGGQGLWVVGGLGGGGFLFEVLQGLAFTMH